MYKALNIRDNAEIVILDSKWLRSITQLRAYDYQDLLVCQGCKQPVRVRAGEHRRVHFAHKHLNNCDYADESAVLRNARAVLYEWLVNKFGENVTIEKKTDEVDLFRPIDCWVTQGSTVFAYWLFDKQLKLGKRCELQEGLKKLGIQINWVFAREMLRTEQDDPDKLVLSTTEREFIKRSKYDIPGNGYYGKGSLHYLDAENRKLTTYRCLSLYHEPQIYKGRIQSSDLEKILVSPGSGEFVHDGEHEKYQEYRQEGVYKPRLNWEGFSFQEDHDIPFQPPDSEIIDSTSENKPDAVIDRSWFQDSKYPSNSDFPEPKIGKCVFCGKETQDWWAYDGRTGECKCYSCKRQGKE